MSALPGLMKSFPSRVTAMITASSLSASVILIGLYVFTRFTGTVLDNMGVMTMKIMSTTSITSTMGVTLISETTGIALGSLAILNSSSNLLNQQHRKGAVLPCSPRVDSTQAKPVDTAISPRAAESALGN